MTKTFLLIRPAFLIAGLILATSCASVKKYNKQISKNHTVSELREDVDIAYAQLKKYHPKLYQYTAKETLDFKFDSLKQAIKTPLTSREFYEKLAQVVTHVHQGHISVSPPYIKRKRKARKKFRDKKFAFNAMDFEYLNDKLWVIDANEKDSALVGAEVVAVGGAHPKFLIEKYNTLIASDGYNTTLFEGMVGSRFPKFYRKNQGFVDSLKVTFKNTDSVFNKTFHWIAPKDKAEKDSTANSKKQRMTREERKAARIARREKRKLNDKYGYIKEKDEFTRIFKFMDSDSTVAYMKIRGFTNGSYDDFYEESFAAMDAVGTKHLIIDLRDNGGGRLAEINELYGYLTDEEYQFINKSEVTNRLPFLNFLFANGNSWFLKGLGVVFSPFIAVHNLIKTEKQEEKIYYRWKYTNTQKPKENTYKGAVYVLINGNSFSASSILSTHLKATDRATFIGQETGGAYNGTVAGLFRNYELPNTKVRLRMGIMQLEAPYKTAPDGYGVKPDVEITPTRKDREAGIDSELQYVLNKIKSGK
ncbi:peptidase S41 [Marixanthomonas spongiae]|uniref:Peptidase S41 n=2 Tax=Marixanthomonas spongiae TaxID=2174845 RepID=A0A2U0I408_9FLAO|nr:peptidase S41 [Marixanthomonas spongiae]